MQKITPFLWFFTALNGGPHFKFSEAFSFVVSSDKDPKRASRVTQALLQMKRLISPRSSTRPKAR